MRVFIVRHGESEANEKSEAYPKGKRYLYDQAIAPNYLTYKGILQAKTAGRSFAEFWQRERQGGEARKLQVIYSPVKRAQQTMDFFLGENKDLKLAAEKNGLHGDWRIAEQQDGGYAAVHDLRDQMLAKGTWVASHPDMDRHGNPATPLSEGDKVYLEATKVHVNPDNPAEAWPAGDWYNAKPPKGESAKEMLVRVREFVEEKLAGGGDEDVVLFSHSGTAAALKIALETCHLPPEEKRDRSLINTAVPPGNAEIMMFETDAQGHFVQKPFDSKAQTVTDDDAAKFRKEDQARRPGMRVNEPRRILLDRAEGFSR